ncbi:MAG: hypothetical protein QOF53_9 [Nocardioidaceae bacterium]|nr:hypothetical protein [Nocardioidaceae bacterium]
MRGQWDARPARRRRRAWSVVPLLAVLALLAAAVAGTVLLRRDGPTAPVPPTTPTRVLVGAALHDNGDPAALEQEAGSHLEIRRTFWGPEKLEASVAVARADVAAGRVPLLSYKIRDWRAADAGRFDSWARSAAQQLGALGGTVMVAIHHEPEGDGDIRLWTRMQQRLAPFFDRPHLRYGVILTGYAQLYGPPRYSLESLWPTGAPIRFLGLDIYQPYGTVDKQTGAEVTRWTDLERTYFPRVEKFARSKHVTWGIAETGLTDRAFAERPSARTWFSSTVDAVSRWGGSFFVYFDSAQNSGTNTWPLRGRKRTAFLRLLDRAPVVARS